MNVRCPNCRALFSSQSDVSGKTLRCPKCENRFRVPDSEAEPDVAAPIQAETPSEQGPFAVPPEFGFVPSIRSAPQRDQLTGNIGSGRAASASSSGPGFSFFGLVLALFPVMFLAVFLGTLLAWEVEKAIAKSEIQQAEEKVKDSLKEIRKSLEHR